MLRSTPVAKVEENSANGAGTTMTTFSEYQAMVERTNERPSRAVSLMGLVGEVGDLHSMMKKLLLQKDNPLFRTELREEFGDFARVHASQILVTRLNSIESCHWRKVIAAGT